MKRKDLFCQKKIYIVLCISVLLTLFCVFKLVMPNQSYHYDGELTLDNGMAGQEVAIYDQIVLPIGVYEIQMEYKTDTSMQSLCTVKDGTVFHGGLLTNGEHLYKNLNSTGFRLWLFESTESMQVIVWYSGSGDVITGNLTIRETNALWTMLLVLIWGLTFLVVGMLVFREYDRIKQMNQEKKIVMGGLLVVIFIASLPYLQGGCVDGADLVYHLQRIEGVKDGILSGQFPLRIEPEWLFGHGYANSIFYCNTLLYFPAILRLLGFTVTTCYNLYCIALNIATAWIAYYCFMKIFQNCYVGLLCSALYTLSVFRIYKLTITAALGEGSAFTFIPLVIYGMYRALTEDRLLEEYKTVWIPIAVGYAGLMQTHVLTCEITAFLTIIICITSLKRIFRKETFFQLSKGALAAVAMSFWYLVPFLDYYLNENVHVRHVSARTIQDRGLYLPQLFFHWWRLGDNAVSGDQGMVESHAMGIGLVLGIGFFLFCVLWFSGEFRKLKLRVLSLGKFSCLLGAVLMLMSLNIFPWDRIQRMNAVASSFVSSVQFPNRFLGWGTAFLVTVCGCLLCFFYKRNRRWFFYVGAVCVLIGVSTSSIFLIDHVCRDTTYLYIYNEEGMGFGYISGEEYLVEGTKLELLDFGVPSTSEYIELTGYMKKYLRVVVKCINNVETEGYMEVPILHYTGYRAYARSTGEELPMIKGTNNLVRVMIPPGFTDEVEIKFVSPLSWRISEMVTYIWWLVMSVTFISKVVGRRKTQTELRKKRENNYA